MEFEQINFGIWTNTLEIWTNTILQFGQMHFVIWTNIFGDLDKYSLRFEQILNEATKNAFHRRADICAIPACKNSLGSTRERAKQQQQTIKGKSPSETGFSSVFGNIFEMYLLSLQIYIWKS